jgi:Fe-S-cluster-containing dehydrogenase component
MLIDYKYCTGCHACELTCRNEHEIPLDQWGIKLAEMGPVQLNGKWMWNYVPVPSDLCDLCADRVAEGKKAPCEVHCLGACIEIVPIADVSAKIAEKGDTVSVFVP